MPSSAISLPLHGPRPSSASEYLARARNSDSFTPPVEESDLLRSIRVALRGSGTELASSIHSTWFIPPGDQPEEEELTWDAHTAILSSGGVMRKKWTFEKEEQAIQWACIGLLDQSSSMVTSFPSSAAHYTSNSAPPPPSSSDRPERPTFGPFARVYRTQKQSVEQDVRVPAVFVFLRSIGKIFLRNGLEYTFSIPVVVRKAWPISPSGVMIQRVLEPTELEEAEVTGDPVLPTIFTVTSPFAEAASIGLTSGIIGGFDGLPPSLKDEDENSTKPLKPIAHSETVIWASHRGLEAHHDIVVTLNIDKRQLSIWRYVYMKPKDTPVPLNRSHSKNVARKRQSIAPASRRSSTIFNPLSPKHGPCEPLPAEYSDFGELPPLSALPGMPPSLSTTTTMASLVSGTSSQLSEPTRVRRNSLTRNDLSVTMDRMVLGGRIEIDPSLAPIEHGRMKAAFWMEKIYSRDISEIDSQSWRNISASLFDHRWDGKVERSLLSICLPSTGSLLLFSVYADKNMLKLDPLTQLSAVSATSIRATRSTVWDLLIVKPDYQLSLLTHGVCEVPIEVNELPSPSHDDSGMDVDMSISRPPHGKPIGVEHGSFSSVTVVFEDKWKAWTNVDLVPQDKLTEHALRILALVLPADLFFMLHHTFLKVWSAQGLRTSGSVEFDSFTTALYRVFDMEQPEDPVHEDHPWTRLSNSASRSRFRDDPVLRKLHLPRVIPARPPRHLPSNPRLLAPVLFALHAFGEDLRLEVDRHQSLLRLVPVICAVALIIRPEWADYWKRLCPDALSTWPCPVTTSFEHLDDRIPVWPPDLSAVLYGRISNPEWKVPWHESHHMAQRFQIDPSFAYGRSDPLTALQQLTPIYKSLADNVVSSSSKRAENAIYALVTSQVSQEFLDRLPLGISAPLREAARTCQLAPPPDWPLAAYEAIGRDDVAASASRPPDMLLSDGYGSVKDFLNPSRPRRTINELVSETTSASAGDVLETVTGVELGLEDFTDIRFGQDRRLEEVARMLCSSTVPSVRVMERPELSEHDQAKEQQHQVIRIAERTLALPYGRAMFTFGSLSTITREAYVVPKFEFSIRLQPVNTTVTPEPGKLAPEAVNWGEFHNGVAAGLRISPSASGVESSWIAFNKPAELTPVHAGFLFGLGLTGHLREMLTWHTFGYLTPKHDLTSIAVLLGLSAANIGSGNSHVTKLLAVHTPALLPTPNVDLNVSLMTQAAGLAGVGLLYMGTKNRRMAEVCLSQISRKDLVQPDLSNEHREAYTTSAALAFGMIMLGKGTMTPADMDLVARLSVLIHGESFAEVGRNGVSFDINLTSPAATVALGLMYLRTERQDIADMLQIPDTVLALNRIQPNFLMMRILARSLIMWNSVLPTAEWLSSQIPRAIGEAVERLKAARTPMDDALELAYWNILAACCFVIGLKYAGTARQEAYMLIIRHFDLFTRMVYSNSNMFDHKIKRSAVRDGLNLITISLSMVMAGTGEISCFRRLRYAYGMYHQAMYHPAFKYGIHVATHLSLGLLFLGGGRFTLGTSDAAIACLVTAFYPRSHQMSSDNRSFLQALRHLWALAIEPRCLIARDVGTSEVVYLPVKITMKEGSEVGTTQLISPTLIPDLDKLLSIRVDTPRYWPFYVDTENIPRHKENLLRSQTLYVKRRTAFLSYTEDPRGSRSLFVRSRTSSGDAATLDFPQLTDTKTHPAGDLSEFITSFSNDVFFLAFADHFSREDGETDEERLFHTYCHASLLDCILQGKPQTLQSLLTLFRYRTMSPASPYFHLRLQDLRFAADFYGKIYDRRFSGRSENNHRVPLIREGTVSGALHALDQQLEIIRAQPEFLAVLGQYARGEPLAAPEAVCRQLAWYLLRDGVPVSTLLVILKGLAHDAHAQCLGRPLPEGTPDTAALDLGIKEVLHATGTKMTTALGSGWSVRSLDEIIVAWTHSGF